MRTILAMIMTLVPLLGAMSPVLANGVDRGGGDMYEQELRALGHQVATKLQALRTETASQKIEVSSELLNIDLVAFLAAVDTIPVISTDDPVLVLVDGKQVPREAANSVLEKTIWVNRPMWNNPANGRIAKQSIALHEYLGILNVDRAYQISLLYRQRLEFEADTTQFKIALADQVKDLGGALSDHFKVNFEPAFARMETIATTGEYQHCIDKKWRASKPERLAECFGVTAMILRAAKLQPVPADTDLRSRQLADGSVAFAFEMMKAQRRCGKPHPRALLNWLFDSNRKWQIVCPKLDAIIAALDAPHKIEDTSAIRLADQKYLVFVNDLPTQERKNFALATHNKLIEEFSVANQDINSQLKVALSGANTNCPGDLAEGIRCGIPFVINTVNSTVQASMLLTQKHLVQTTLDNVRAVYEYAE